MSPVAFERASAAKATGPVPLEVETAPAGVELAPEEFPLEAEPLDPPPHALSRPQASIDPTPTPSIEIRMTDIVRQAA
jgi:hypothetical protein